MNEDKMNKIKEFAEWILCIAIALVIAILFRYYIGTPTIVKQPSMYPTLEEDQRLWLNRWPRTIKKLPKVGDIVTFEAPTTTVLSESEVEESVVARYEEEPKGIISKFKHNVLELNKISYIKRVIGVPGDKIKIKNGKVYVNNVEIEEKYLQSGIVTDNGKGYCTEIEVPENSVFVLGDNRAQSTDSRCFGCIPLEKIESKVLLRIWPLKSFGKIDK